MPLAIINNYKENDKKNKPLYIAGFICAFVSIIAILFKVQHWGGSGALMIIGIPLPFLYFLPVYIYYHNKEKEKSSMNLMGVMLLMVFIALFSASLSISVSKVFLDSLRRSAEELSQTSELYAMKNAATIESINKTTNTEISGKLSELRKRSDVMTNKIEDVKKELVLKVANYDPSVINNTKLTLATLEPATESNVTTFTMRGNDEIPGKATEIKNALTDYRKYLNSIIAGNKESLEMVNSLLNTDASIGNVNGENQTIEWEDSFFPVNSYIISVLGNLDCIKTNVEMAEAEALSSLCCKTKCDLK
jgi:hypothetical protein